MGANISDSAKRLEDALAPYGYYLGEKGEENKLRLEFIALGTFALGVLLWGTVEYAKAFISEKAKNDVKNIFGEGKGKDEDLKNQLQEVLSELHQVKARLNSTEALILSQINEDRLIGLFTNAGFSKRAATKAAQEVRPLLAAEVAALMKD